MWASFASLGPTCQSGRCFRALCIAALGFVSWQPHTRFCRGTRKKKKKKEMGGWAKKEKRERWLLCWQRNAELIWLRRILVHLLMLWKLFVLFYRRERFGSLNPFLFYLLFIFVRLGWSANSICCWAVYGSSKNQVCCISRIVARVGFGWSCGSGLEVVLLLF